MVSAPMIAPDRGDVIWLDFDPQVGHEQARRRPALVLSPRRFNDKRGLAIVCPLTTQVRGYPFGAAVPPGEGVSGAVLADQIKSLYWRARKPQYICKLSHETVDEVLALLEALLWE